METTRLTQPEQACFEAQQKERAPEWEQYLDQLEANRREAIDRAEHERRLRKRRIRPGGG